MKKLSTQTFLAVLFSILGTQITQAQTHVSGSVYTSTTWTKVNSPYIVDSNLVFFPGANLTIEPGVVVKFAEGAQLEIRESDFKANGTINDTIVFTSNSAAPTDTSYLGIKFTSMLKVEMTYCIIEYAVEGISEGVNFTKFKPFQHCIFRNNRYALGKDMAIRNLVIDQCLFSNNKFCGFNNYADAAVLNSAFINNYRGLIAGTLLVNSVFCGNHFGVEYFDTVRNCQFMNNDTGYLGLFKLMTNCSFTQNHTGIYASINQSDTLRDNNIFDNLIGITLDYNYSKNTVFNNRICKNTLYNIKYTQKPNNALQNNCWCETDSALVAAKIYDGYDDNKLGLINFVPFNSCDSTALDSIPAISCQMPTPIKLGISIETSDMKQLVSIYPNPANEQITVEHLPSNSLISIYDITGRKVSSINNISNNIQIDLNHIPSGLYILHVNESNYKFIKQ